MSRAQERSTGLQSGAQATQRTTGDVTGTGGNVTGSGNVTGATSAGLRDPAATTSYARGTGTGTGTGASYQTSGRADTGHVGAGGVLAMVAGLLTFFAGLSAVVKRAFYHAQPGYAYRLNVHAWGWILLVLGVLLFAAGATHLLGMSFGKIAGVGIAVLTAIAGFLFLVYYPVWGIIIVALSVLAIWSLLRDDSAGQGAGGGSSYGSGAVGSSSGTMSSGTTTTTTRSRNRI
jgi:hypothetical protein